MCFYLLRGGRGKRHLSEVEGGGYLTAIKPIETVSRWMAIQGQRMRRKREEHLIIPPNCPANHSKVEVSGAVVGQR